MCLCSHVSSEDSPSSAEKVQDCDVLLEPTLLGPLRGDGSTVSLLVHPWASLLDAVYFFSPRFLLLLFLLFNQFSLLKNWSLQLVGLPSRVLQQTYLVWKLWLSL